MQPAGQDYVETMRGYPRVERVARKLRGHGVMTGLRRATNSIRSAFVPSR